MRVLLIFSSSCQKERNKRISQNTEQCLYGEQKNNQGTIWICENNISWTISEQQSGECGMTVMMELVLWESTLCWVYLMNHHTVHIAVPSVFFTQPLFTRPGHSPGCYLRIYPTHTHTHTNTHSHKGFMFQWCTCMPNRHTSSHFRTYKHKHLRIHVAKMYKLLSPHTNIHLYILFGPHTHTHTHTHTHIAAN